MSKRPIGIFGGTFNPIHYGHVRAAIEVAEALGLDAVEFVPSARPPHKKDNGLLDFDTRLTLCRLAVADIPEFSVNPMESDRPGPSYTCDTLTELSKDRPEAEWYFIMGLLDLFNLPGWKNGLELGCLANLVVHAREGLGLSDFGDFVSRHAREMGASASDDPAVWNLPGGRRIVFVPVTRLDISASDIRERWRRRKRLNGLVPESVLRELLKRQERLQACWTDGEASGGAACRS